MKRCQSCGIVKPENTFEGNICGFCDKIRADVMIDLQYELGML